MQKHEDDVEHIQDRPERNAPGTPRRQNHPWKWSVRFSVPICRPTRPDCAKKSLILDLARTAL